MNSEHITILIVDDHVIIRKSIAMILSLEPDFEIVGTIGSGNRAVETARALQPDLIVLNLIVYDSESISSAIALRTSFPDIAMLALTSVEADKGLPKSLARVLTLGISSLIPREARPDELVLAIRKIARGEVYKHPKFMQYASYPYSSLPIECYLTPREQEILQRMATPATYREIADVLSLSEETVRSHAKNILAKLKQPNRFQAVLEAVRYGFVELSPYDLEDDLDHAHHRSHPRCVLTDKGIPPCVAEGKDPGECPIRTNGRYVERGV